jgi:hypothetical protein
VAVRWRFGGVLRSGAPRRSMALRIWRPVIGRDVVTGAREGCLGRPLGLDFGEDSAACWLER